MTVSSLGPKLRGAGSLNDDETMLNASREHLEKAQLALGDLIEARERPAKQLSRVSFASTDQVGHQHESLLPNGYCYAPTLSPMLSNGDDLYGVSLDLDWLESCAFVSLKKASNWKSHTSRQRRTTHSGGCCR